MSYSFIKNQIKKGNSIARAYQNNEFLNHNITGVVLDVGGGRSPDYYKYLNTKDVIKIIPEDYSISGINFEEDKLPYEDNSIDTVVCSNLFEHIFNYQFLSDEIYRVIKNDGFLIGTVPYLVCYHPDPRDYFRYSKESLRKIFEKSGYNNIYITEVGIGPFLVSLNTILLSLPKFLRTPLFGIAYYFDKLYLRKNKDIKERFPLAYVFKVKK